MNNSLLPNESAKLLRMMTDRLAGAEIYPAREARNIAVMLIAWHTKLSLAEMLLEKEISGDIGERIEEDFKKVMDGHPVQYVLGETEFCGRLFHVDNRVLIPRPETEELVRMIVADVDKSQQLKILDVGTGSGCIAVSLKCELAAARVYATDISGDALKIAAINSYRHCAEAMFVPHDITTVAPAAISAALPDTFDLIVSNPPYVRRSETRHMRGNVLNHEPHTALFVDDNAPLVFYAAILEFAALRLARGGFIYVEINEALGTETLQLFSTKGYKSELIKDLSGKNRFVKAENVIR